MTSPDLAAFLPWSGGANPAPGRIVQVVFRAQPVPWLLCPSEQVDWSASMRGSQIVAYRVVERAAA